MSRPQPIQYRLSRWSIDFNSDPTMRAVNGETILPYRAEITWEAEVSEVQHPNSTHVLGHKDKKDFETFDQAKAWVDEQIEESQA